MARRPKGKSAAVRKPAPISADKGKSLRMATLTPTDDALSASEQVLPFADFGDADETSDVAADEKTRAAATDTKGKGKAVSKTKKPTGGTGKKRKVFAEDGGIAHLVALSNTISAQHEDDLQRRVEKSHDKQAWQKGKRREKQEGQQRVKQIADRQAQADVQSNESGGANGVKPNNLLTKARARANIVAKTREKTRLRKEGRRTADRAGDGQNGARLEADVPSDKRAKRVSFA